MDNFNINYVFGELDEANTPNEIRESLFKISRDNAQVRNILDHAKYSGLSDEDTYVILAYELLKENLIFKKQAIKSAMLKPAGPIVIK